MHKAIPLPNREFSFFKDARHFQIVFLGLFLLFGIFRLGWDSDWLNYLITIASCVLFQMIACMIWGKDFSSIKSAIISSLGLCLLLKTNSTNILILSAALTIFSKFTIRANGKHIFNPVNFGIVISILISGDAWISPGQWGSDWILLFFMGTAALMILIKVGRIDTSLSFLLTFFILELVRSCFYLGWPLDFVTHKFLSGTVLLFTFFMITDPMTTPNHPKARIIWGILLAIVSFILSDFMYVYTAPVWTLFLIAPFTPLFDKILKHQKFQWI